MNFQKRDEEEVGVNLTPLIDVVFILLLFFMVTTTFNRHSELRIDLPEASTESQPEQQKQLEIAIDATGTYYVNGTQMINTKAETLLLALRKAIGNDKEVPVSIRADAKTPHQSVITAMDAASKLGLTKMSIATTETTE